MANNKEPQTNVEQKVKTKYERKMEERKIQEEKDKRKSRALQIGAIIIGIAIIIAVVGSIVASVTNKNKAFNSPYVTVGSYEIMEPEYQYYYSTTVNNYLSTYSPILSYIGLDPSVDFSLQQYTEDLTWKDLFDQMTVEQIKQTKAIVDDAAAQQFTYDDTQRYEEVLASMTADAQAKNLSMNDYYKASYGPYATEKVLEPYIKEGILASTYYEDLMAQNAPTDQEIKDYYADHVLEYDKVDYRSFTFKADVAEDSTKEEIDRAMLDIKKKAEDMMEAREEGADFKALSLENASEDDKATYEDAESDPSLKEARSYNGTASVIAQWLYEDGRAEGDIAVLEDTESNQYHVVEFINRYYDEADDTAISNVIAGERVTEYINGLTEAYTVTDNRGELKYLKVDLISAVKEAISDGSASEEDSTTEEVTDTP